MIIDIETYEGPFYMEEVYSPIKTDGGKPKRIDLTNCVIYMKKGKCHNLEGPAVYNKLTDTVSYYIEGRPVNVYTWAKQATISDEEKARLIFIHGE